MHPLELELPLPGSVAGALMARRLEHLRLLVDDEAIAERLAAAFPSLASIYGASTAELERVVGAVSAARVRWFLDAPLGAVQTWHHRPERRAVA